MTRLGLAILLCLAAGPAAAQRTLAIERFDADIVVTRDGTVEVAETILARFAGSWNGIYRTVPVKYRTPQGFNWTLQLELVGATGEDGRALRVERERDAWNMAVNKNSIHGYYAYLEKYPEGIYAEEAENRVIDMEIALIQKNSDGEMPKADGEKSDIISDYAIVEFENSTPYELTIYLSGAVNKKKVILDPGESIEVELLNGHYTTAASVKASDVTSYAGFDDYQGGYLYSIEFYISYGFDYNWGN